MFDVSWSELLVLGIVTLVCVGPKDLPRFMAMIGKYTGMARRQATEFRRHFDDAMRQAELDTVRQDIDQMARDVNERVMAASQGIEADVRSAKAALAAPVSTSASTVSSDAVPADVMVPKPGSTPAP